MSIPAAALLFSLLAPTVQDVIDLSSSQGPPLSQDAIQALRVREAAAAHRTLAFTVESRDDTEPEWHIDFSAKLFVSGESWRLEKRRPNEGLTEIYCWNGEAFARECREDSGMHYIERSMSVPNRYALDPACPDNFGLSYRGVPLSKVLGRQTEQVEHEVVAGVQCLKVLVRKARPGEPIGWPTYWLWLDEKNLSLCKARVIFEPPPGTATARPIVKCKDRILHVYNEQEVAGICLIDGVPFPSQVTQTAVTPILLPGSQRRATLDQTQSRLSVPEGTEFTVPANPAIREIDLDAGSIRTPGVKGEFRTGAELQALCRKFGEFISLPSSIAAIDALDQDKLYQCDCAGIAQFYMTAIVSPSAIATPSPSKGVLHTTSPAELRNALAAQVPAREFSVAEVGWERAIATPGPYIGLLKPVATNESHYALIAPHGNALIIVTPLDGVAAVSESSFQSKFGGRMVALGTYIAPAGTVSKSMLAVAAVIACVAIAGTLMVRARKR